MKVYDCIARLKDAHESHARRRQEVIGLANAAQHAAKRAIFAVLRDDAGGASSRISEADKALAAIAALSKSDSRLAHEGSYRAALEEYAEALFVQSLVGKGIVPSLEGFDEETIIAGLSDAAGELTRRMTVKGTEGDLEEVRRLKALVEEIVAGLTDMDYGGYLRTKYDQARNHLRKAEDILYELSIRR